MKKDKSLPEGFHLSGKPLDLRHELAIERRMVDYLERLPFGQLVLIHELAMAVHLSLSHVGGNVTMMPQVMSRRHRIAGSNRYLYGSEKTIEALKKELGAECEPSET